MAIINPDVFNIFFRKLIQIAQDKRVITYHELENAFGFSHNVVGAYAYYVGKYCIEQDLPMLNSLIISATDCKPSYELNEIYKKDKFFEDYKYQRLDWGDMLSECWKCYHLTSSRKKQVQNFAGISVELKYWASSIDD